MYNINTVTQAQQTVELLYNSHAALVYGVASQLNLSAPRNECFIDSLDMGGDIVL